MCRTLTKGFRHFGWRVTVCQRHTRQTWGESVNDWENLSWFQSWEPFWFLHVTVAKATLRPKCYYPKFERISSKLRSSSWTCTTIKPCIHRSLTLKLSFRYLVKFLAKLAQDSDINKMTPSNIAIVLGPNLLWAKAEGWECRTSTTCSANRWRCLNSRRPVALSFQNVGGDGSGYVGPCGCHHWTHNPARRLVLSRR